MSETYKIDYNKLVRDKVPEIIAKRDESCQIEVVKLEGDDFRPLLLNKLIEEATEVRRCLKKNHNDSIIKLKEDLIDELADVEEVLLAIKKEFGITSEEISEVRKRKAENSGTFDDKTFLGRVILEK